MAQGSPLVQAVLAALQKYPQLDPNAVLAVSSREGLSGGIGDGGHAFGPFQLNNAGGVITGMFPGETTQQIQDWATSPAGLNFALSRINNVAAGLKGAPAIANIVSRFERPLNIPGEIAGADAAYGAPLPTTFQPPAGATTGPGALAPMPARVGGPALALPAAPAKAAPTGINPLLLAILHGNGLGGLK